MFTGIVEELGTVRSRDGGRFEFNAKTVTEGVALGDSIACNGVCLTVVAYGDDWFAVDVVDESLSRSNLGSLVIGDPVNFERPVRVSDRLGGHIVQGHVDGVGTLRHAAPDLSVSCGPELLKYMVEKGSVTIDGISLTIVSVDDGGFTVAVIPHTMEVTTLGARKPGDQVNLEVDVVAKYVERLLEGHN
jgi:riboflavin synthase